MRKHIIYVIRYSILQKSKAWRIARKHDYETYRSKLFATERLRLKQALFTRFTLPSLESMSSVDDIQSRTVLLMVSPHLPETERRALEYAIKPYPEIQLLEIAENERVANKVEDYLLSSLDKTEKHIVGTVRLDDDDALAPQFELEALRYLSTDYAGKVISFSRGYELLVQSENLEAIKAQRLNLPKIALGLTYVAQIEHGQVVSSYSNVYQLGSHDEAERAAELVKDNSFHAYIRVAYAEQDTEAEGFKRREKQGANEESLDVLQSKFPGVQLL